MFDFEKQIDPKTLKYVLYARKSTVDESRQIKSIEDQIHECKRYAEHRGLTIVEVLQESKSAKLPNQRPVFSQMLEDIEAGKYDGILSWHPDRLARNMLEGGQVIDHLDQMVIKDLQFVTHHYEPNANGKMLLGMAFVLSKQYSDNLSQNVTRGVRRNLARGKAAMFKHGYTKDENGFYVPDPESFVTIQQAWHMRERGETLRSIVEFLDESGYKRITKKKKREITISPQQLSSIFKDSTYYGVLVQTGKEVDLREIYDFEPMITEHTFNKIQAMTQGRSKKTYKGKRNIFYPLRHMVLCGHCGNAMTPYSPSTRALMYYRCTKKECDSPKKDVRAKVVFSYIYDFLENGLGFTKEDYQQYRKELGGVSEGKSQEIQLQIHSKQGALKHVKSEMRRIAIALPQIADDDDVKQFNQEEFQDLTNQSDKLQAQIIKLKEKLPNVEEEIMSQEDFLNMSKNAAEYVKKGNEFVKDAVCRQIFLNITLKNGKVATHQLKEPFLTTMKQRLVKNGRGDRTRTCDLTLPKRAL